MKLNEGWALKNERGKLLIRAIACSRRELRDNRNWEKLKKDGYKIVKVELREIK